MQPLKEYRPNPSRALYLNGEINQALVDRLTPDIIRLRTASQEPIAVYIDSPGGDIRSAEVIRNLIRSSSQDGQPIRLLTVVTGWAASAAADLLALGDYSMAFPHARILYHGSRRMGSFELTVERASVLARSLHQTNEFFADRLGRTLFPRFLLRVSLLDEGRSLPAYVKAADVNDRHPDVCPIVDALKQRLSPPIGCLVVQAQQLQTSIQHMDAEVLASVRKKSLTIGTPEFEQALFEAILKFKAKQHKKDKWLLSDGGLLEVMSDFDLLHDFHFGPHMRTLNAWVGDFGPLFLTDEQRGHFNQLQKTAAREAQAAYLQKHAARKIRMLWFFIVSFCRNLQRADYEFLPQDAYWMGLVNEIIGSELLCEREMAEAEDSKVGV